MLRKSRFALLALAIPMLLAAPLLGAEKAAKPAASLVDVNSASQAELEAVKGIGQATAKKIIANRPYKSLDDLSKTGIPAKTIEKLKPLLTVGSGAPAAAAPAVAAPAAAAPTAAPRAMSPTAGAKTAKAAEVSSSVAPQSPPVKGMVWVNTSTKVFHREGDAWYGKTKHGKFMTEDDAIKAGYHESKEKSKKQ